MKYTNTNEITNVIYLIEQSLRLFYKLTRQQLFKEILQYKAFMQLIDILV